MSDTTELTATITDLRRLLANAESALFTERRSKVTSFDVSGFGHCGELHTRVGQLLTLLDLHDGHPLIQCATCSEIMISQVEGSAPQNLAMESCSRCHERRAIDDY